MTEKTFNTAEKFLMIAHHPEKGWFMIPPLHIKFGIAGAILLDMAIDEKIDMTNKRLILKSESIPADPVKAEVTGLMLKVKKPRTTFFWVKRIAMRYLRYKWLVLKGLEDKRIVRIENRRFLGFIPYRKSYLVESYTRSNIIRQLKNDILVYRGTADDDVALAGLVKVCRMNRLLSSDRDELKMLRSQLKQIVKDSPEAGAVKQTIRQIQLAIMASVTAAIATSNAGSH